VNPAISRARWSNARDHLFIPFLSSQCLLRLFLSNCKQKRTPLQIICSSLMKFFSRIYLIPYQCMIGRWTWSLLSLIFCVLTLKQGGEDKICWIPSKRWKFEVRSFYHALSIPAGSHFLGRVFGELRSL
jgi:hypothetical protein